MPIYLRNFYLQKLINTKKSEADAMKKSSGKSNSPTSVSRSNIPRK